QTGLVVVAKLGDRDRAAGRANELGVARGRVARLAELGAEARAIRARRLLLLDGRLPLFVFRDAIALGRRRRHVRASGRSSLATHHATRVGWSLRGLARFARIIRSGGARCCVAVLLARDVARAAAATTTTRRRRRCGVGFTVFID